MISCRRSFGLDLRRLELADADGEPCATACGYHPRACMAFGCIILSSVGLLRTPSSPQQPSWGQVASRSQPLVCRLQVVTDIDDTIKSSGGVALAGIPLGGVDTSYQRNSVYPGVFHFAAALAAQSIMGPPAPVAVLTARAEEVGAMMPWRKVRLLASALET